MKKLSKLTALLLAAVMALSLAACAGPGAENTQPVETKGSQGEPAGGKYTVGICQQDQHPALDAATQGFKDALVEKLGQDGVAFKEGNASGDTANCPTIINGFLSENVDLILANATGSLQAAHSATADIPILGTSVTDYATALELENWSGTVGGNISGTSDLAPLDQQAEMLHELFPDAQNVGLLYCSGEPNSVYQCDVIEGYLKEMGYSVSRFAFTDTNDVASVAQTACDGSDVIYIPTDNTAAKNTEAIANVVLPAKVPVIAGEEGLCKGCGVATLTISYYDIGHIAGEMAYEILANGADISTMPVKSAPQVVKKYNAANCEALGIAAPEGYEAIAAE
ncbi:MAG: ABC transporter substrate-binding protein [Oscillospiraceae bacterium]|nr:ABC transporter substrate-binding protein [Oscillospiraceae bacterium]